jgi:hypothetical protein
MLIFTLSFIAVIIISFCFFKNKFWENRYLVLLIGSGVALVATLVVNFSIRGEYDIKTETVWKRPLYTFYLPDSLIKDTLKTPLIKHWNYYGDNSAKVFFKDSLRKQIPATIVLYTVKKRMYVGTFKKTDKQRQYEFKCVYIVSSSADTIAYVSRKRIVYDVKPNKWVEGTVLPPIKSITILYVPPKEYALIPDSLKRELPKNFKI